MNHTQSVRIGGDHLSVLGIVSSFEKATRKKVKVTQVKLDDPKAEGPEFVFPKLLASSFYNIPEDKWDNGLFAGVKPMTLEQYAKEKFAK
jgi:hypothetical protein